MSQHTDVPAQRGPGENTDPVHQGAQDQGQDQGAGSPPSVGAQIEALAQEAARAGPCQRPPGGGVALGDHRERVTLDGRAAVDPATNSNGQAPREGDANGAKSPAAPRSNGMPGRRFGRKKWKDSDKLSHLQWQQWEQLVLDALDIEEVYRGLGVEITGKDPNSNGWLACRAKGREDSSPSAAINVGDGAARGRYVDKGGEQESLNLWEFAARYGPYGDWREARAALARSVGVELPNDKEPEPLEKQLDFLSWRRYVAQIYCDRKDPIITPEAIRETGAQLASWPVNAPNEGLHGVIAFPGYGPCGVNAPPVAWALVSDRGDMIRCYQGEDAPCKEEKTHCLRGSQSSLLNAWALERLEQAEVIWVAEGITDMLALQSCIPAALKETHLVITNGFGAGEKVQDSWVRMLAGKTVHVVGDCDSAGQHGAARWVSALVGHAKDLRNVLLPYEVVSGHGKDLRDFLGSILKGDEGTFDPGFQQWADVGASLPAKGNRTREDAYRALCALASKAIPVSGPSTANGQQGGNPAGPQGPGPRRGRQTVKITPDEHDVVRQVTDALAADSRLFQRDGKLVRAVKLSQADPPRTPGASRSLQSVRPAGLVVLRPAETPYVRLRITRRCFLEQDRGDMPQQVHPPTWLPSGVQATPGKIRTVVGVLPGPTLDSDGRLISSRGYDPGTRWLLGRDLPGLVVPDTPTQADAVAAAGVIGDLVRDFPWQDPRADKARWLCLLLTACCRHLIGRTPLGLITANVAGAGKTYLARLVSIIAHGLTDPILMSWPEGTEMQCRGDEIRKRLASLLHESAALVLIDNLPRGEDFSSPELDAFVTADAYSDRQLGKNDGSRVGGPNRCLLLATGNRVMPCGDTADRTLVVRLLCTDPNPRARPPSNFTVKDLERHALAERPRYLGAALTIWRAWIEAGSPRPPGESWGTFDNWVDTVAAIVRWLGWGDPLAGRVAQMSETDREGEALTALLSHWPGVLGQDPLAAGEIIRKLEGEHPTDPVRAVRDALAQLGAGSRWPPTSRKLGHTLAAYRDRSVDVDQDFGPPVRMRLQGEQDRHAKTWKYAPAAVDGADVPDLAGIAGIAGIDQCRLPVRSDGGEQATSSVQSGSDGGETPATPAIPADAHQQASVPPAEPEDVARETCPVCNGNLPLMRPGVCYYCEGR